VLDVRDDGDLNEDVDRVEDAPTDEERVPLAVVHEQPGLTREVEPADDAEPRRLRLEEDRANTGEEDDEEQLVALSSGAGEEGGLAWSAFHRPQGTGRIAASRAGSGGRNVLGASL
jgi:hypothetical protein